MLAPVHSTHLLAKLGIRHGFFTRQGGASVGVYGSLNCGYGSGDMRDIVHANRAAVAGYMGVPHAPQSHLLTAHQVHSATAILVETPWAPDRQPKADAMVTRTPGIALGALAADCTPVLFADAEARVVGAAHAGWRGALGGVLEATLDLMVRAGARRDHIVAAVGPCIGPAAYEVGPEFEAEFIKADNGHARYFARSAADARPRFDLPGFVADRLSLAGVGHVDRLNLCTYANSKRFFSYRRTTHAREPDYGRQISAIALL